MKIPFDLAKFTGDNAVLRGSGKKVTIYSTTINNRDYPIMGTRPNDRGYEIVSSWSKDGQFVEGSIVESDLDILLEIPELEPAWWKPTAPEDGDSDWMTVPNVKNPNKGTDYLIYVYEDRKELRTPEFREELLQLVKKHLNK